MGRTANGHNSGGRHCREQGGWLSPHVGAQAISSSPVGYRSQGTRGSCCSLQACGWCGEWCSSHGCRVARNDHKKKRRARLSGAPRRQRSSMIGRRHIPSPPHPNAWLPWICGHPRPMAQGEWVCTPWGLDREPPATLCATGDSGWKLSFNLRSCRGPSHVGQRRRRGLPWWPLRPTRAGVLYPRSTLFRLQATRLSHLRADPRKRCDTPETRRPICRNPHSSLGSLVRRENRVALKVE